MRTITVAISILLLVATPHAEAARKPRLGKIDRMAAAREQAGMRALKQRRYAVSVAALKKSYAMRPTPRVLREIGYAYEKAGNVAQAVSYYKQYLQAAPQAADSIAVSQAINVLTARTQSAAAPPSLPPDGKNNESVATTAPEAPAVAPDAETAPPPVAATGPMPSEWSHTPIDTAPKGQPIDVRVRSPKLKGVATMLYYRPPGAAGFTAVSMERLGPELVGRIPGAAVSGTNIQYYIESRKPSGGLLKRSGSEATPNIVMVTGATAAERPTEDKALEQRRDDEKAPAGPRDDEKAPLGKSAAAEVVVAPPPRSGLTGLGWAGVGLLIGGAAIAGAGGGVGFGLSNNYAQSVKLDAHHRPIFLFNDPDPTIAANDRKLQANGHFYHTLGAAFAAGGGGLAAIGVVLIIADRARMPRAPKNAAPPKKTVLQDVIVAPALSPSAAGVTASFSF